MVHIVPIVMVEIIPIVIVPTIPIAIIIILLMYKTPGQGRYREECNH